MGKESKDKLILEFMGGMGNQMFQYAFYLNLMKNNKKACCAITNDKDGDFPFVLNIFPNVHFEETDYKEYIMRRDRYKNRTYLKRAYNKLFPFTKDIYFENEKKDYDGKLFKLNNKIISGYFQSLAYIDPVENELRNAFIFPEGETKLKDYVKKLKEQEVVGVHIRRGDYLLYSDIYGGICELDYYNNAIDFFLKKGIKHFLFFSNDIAWVKENFNYPYCMYFDNGDFENHQDWYDMYVMSQCSHNIIANSTFSWWGAWLNVYPQKVIIAPKGWINTQKDKNICPASWIRL